MSPVTPPDGDAPNAAERTIERTIRLLWALRSPCNLGCRYCYFGTVEEHREVPVTEAGQLSHLSRDDLPAEAVLAFAATLAGSAVERVFVAGGEPLIWRHVLEFLAAMKGAGVQVVVCTNGIPLNRPEISRALVELGVDAVSISLDSADPVHNDTWRPARNRNDGWATVVSGTRALLSARDQHGRRHGDGRAPRVGFYSVITRRNVNDILDVPALAAELGCDYAVPQPISLEPGHALRAELALTPEHVPQLRDRFAALNSAELPLVLPPTGYPEQVTATVTKPTGLVRGWSGGTTLFFIEPDGSVWDCPSALKIAATPEHRRRSIDGTDAAEMFGPPPACAADCHLFSVDCVNMWPLMAFDRILTPAGATR